MKTKMDAEVKIMTEQRKFKKQCSNCNYKISFYAFEPDKKICKWCGALNYKNDVVKFKDLLLRKKKEAENCECN